ncbi:Zinc phosphodiesterase ELAC protein 1, partial [Halocaridina rubra]
DASMKLHFLGSASSFPTPKRGVSGSVLQHDDGNAWLFDCGEGTQIQIQKVAVSRQKINKVFITHLHGDHLFGLPGLMCTISSSLAEEALKKGRPIIDIYGPQGLRRFLYNAFSLSRSPLIFHYRVHELVPVKEQYPDDWNEWEVDHSGPAACHPSELPGLMINASCGSNSKVHWKLFDDEKWCVIAGWIHHRVPSYGYILKQKERPGTLDKTKLLDLGLPPGPAYGHLKSGKTVTLEDGSIITPDMVMGEPIPGRTLAILGDTNDASPITHLISSCDVLVHEATHDDTLIEKAVEFGHSTPSMAVQIAKKVNAKTLLLNHFSQRYGHVTEDSKSEESVAILEEQALAASKGTSINVQCVDDLYVFELPLPSRHNNTI